MAKEIIITISPTGKVTTDLVGFHGEGCDAVLKDCTTAGDRIKTIRNKPERGGGDTDVLQPEHERARR
jgi:hypothetical protein